MALRTCKIGCIAIFPRIHTPAAPRVAHIIPVVCSYVLVHPFLFLWCISRAPTSTQMFVLFFMGGSAVCQNCVCSKSLSAIQHVVDHWCCVCVCVCVRVLLPFLLQPVKGPKGVRCCVVCVLLPFLLQPVKGPKLRVCVLLPFPLLLPVEGPKLRVCVCVCCCPSRCCCLSRARREFGVCCVICVVALPAAAARRGPGGSSVLRVCVLLPFLLQPVKGPKLRVCVLLPFPLLLPVEGPAGVRCVLRNMCCRPSRCCCPSRARREFGLAVLLPIH